MGKAGGRIGSADGSLWSPCADQCGGGFDLIRCIGIKRCAVQGHNSSGMITLNTRDGSVAKVRLPREGIGRAAGAAFDFQHVLSGGKMPLEEVLHIVHATDAFIDGLCVRREAVCRKEAKFQVS